MNKKVVTYLIVAAFVIIVLMVVIKKMKEGLNDAGDSIVDVTGLPPSVTGVRSTAAKAAIRKIKSLPYLKHAFIEKANAKYNTSSYTLNAFPDNGTNYLTHNLIADGIRGQATILGALVFENSNKALEFIQQIGNQVQAAQVGFALWNLNGKDFSETILWMSDEALIEAADYLYNLPTGVFIKANGHQLTKLTV